PRGRAAGDRLLGLAALLAVRARADPVERRLPEHGRPLAPRVAVRAVPLGRPHARAGPALPVGPAGERELPRIVRDPRFARHLAPGRAVDAGAQRRPVAGTRWRDAELG